MTELAEALPMWTTPYSAFICGTIRPEDAQKIWQTGKEDLSPLPQKYSDTLSHRHFPDSGIF